MSVKFLFMWTALLLEFLKFDGLHSTCSRYSFHVNDGLRDRVLSDRIFMTAVIDEYHSECFSKCVQDCRCLSFNVCGKQCQLNADAKEMRPNSLRVQHGCNYYGLRGSQNATFPTCCLMSNPCLNGGSCTTAEPNSKKRFRCLCNAGFYGDLCQTKSRTSCADFLTKQAKPLSGQYEILDGTDRPYSVYCDFDSEPGFAWTLLLSSTRDNGPAVGGKGLLEDLPVNEDTPNWENYRLSLARMNTLRGHSSHWRATCGYEVYGGDFQDYVRVNLSKTDLSYFDIYNGATACQTIEYMNLVGLQCHECNFALYHTSDYIPMQKLIGSKAYSTCDFDLSQNGYMCSSSEEATLFVVRTCLDPRFRCHMKASSTTQNWFGYRCY